MPQADQDRWLVIIDPQRIFADPNSEWGSPMWGDALQNILELVKVFPAERTIVTRWIPWPKDDRPGSWKRYMELWPFADREPDDEYLGVVDELAKVEATVVEAPTFGKWDEVLAVTGPAPHLVLAGVSTDCCVISTALPAADAGATIELVAEACAGSDENFHAKAIDVMALYEPQIELVSAAAIIERTTSGE